MSAQVDLHDALRRHRYDHAFFCTFNFQPDFFEGYCLEQFDSLEVNDGITVIMDGRALDALVAGPPSQWPQKANLRYLLHGARPAGRFHPKVFLLASKTRGLLVVGSANLTRPGMTRNAELVRAFSFEVDKRELALPLFQSATRFLRDIEKKWPSRELRARLDDLEAEVSWLSGSPAEQLPIHFLHNLETPLLGELTRDLESPVQKVSVVSPFFDEEPTLLDWLQKNVNPAAMEIFTVNGAETLTAAWTTHPLLTGARGEFLFSNWGEPGHSRSLHAKAVAVSHGKVMRLAFGSANFTRAAMLSTADNGNVEVVLALEDFPKKNFDVRSIFDPNEAASAEPLIPTERPEQDAPAKCAFRLVEASLDGLEFKILLATEHSGSLDAVFNFGDGSSEVVPLEGESSDRRAELNKPVASRADRSSTVVFVRTATGLESSRVLLLNLKDLATGGAHRKERRVRDAQRSANQFAAALLELLRLKDTDPLHSFLTYCDIPLIGHSRLRGAAREPFTLDQVQQELRRLGAHNLREYATLHDAVLGFCERHTSRLARHAQRPSIDGIPGCMHVVRSVAGVLATQIERLLAGLPQAHVLSIDEWFNHRRKLDQLLRQWIDLLRVVHTGWLIELGERFEASEIKLEISPDLEPLQDLVRLFSEVRARVLAVMSQFRVMTPRGDRVAPPLTNDNTLSPGAWKRWHDEVVTHQAALDAFSA